MATSPASTASATTEPTEPPAPPPAGPVPPAPGSAPAWGRPLPAPDPAGPLGGQRRVAAACAALMVGVLLLPGVLAAVTANETSSSPAPSGSSPSPETPSAGPSTGPDDPSPGPGGTGDTLELAGLVRLTLPAGFTVTTQADGAYQEVRLDRGGCGLVVGAGDAGPDATSARLEAGLRDHVSTQYPGAEWVVGPIAVPYTPSGELAGRASVWKATWDGERITGTVFAAVVTRSGDLVGRGFVVLANQATDAALDECFEAADQVLATLTFKEPVQ